ncbi:3'-5' exonuclease [Peptacetobacter sp.]|uniref:3'-5' exonuclease n=1 Tax=unclassified Peptacetobacter TaxID=2991974 RepID=UPI002E793C0B|nr:3'-5' exonuclease [Peptacetobacter sp.]MEE0451241.1 3'-5' exonuclease [Peptacetobacter sp.]
MEQMSLFGNDEVFIVVDLETTGLNPFEGNEIIEIGITEIKNGKIVRSYSRFVKPEQEIPPFITELTGISNEMVANEDTIEQVLPRFRKFIGSNTIIAHNAKFDIKFLNYYLNKLGLEEIKDYICTLELLKKVSSYGGKNKKLATACEYYGIENKNAHRASSDTQATAELFLKIRDKVDK